MSATPAEGTGQDQERGATLLRPIRGQLLGKNVIDALIVMIERSGLAVGDRLPPESELSTRLGVGRSTVREALQAWQRMGIVTRNKGAGTVLAAEVSSNSVHVPITLKLEAESLLRTNGVRRPLEVEAVRLASDAASVVQRQHIAEHAATLLDVHQRGGDWREVDDRFHAAILDACGNPLFGQLSRRLHAVFRDIYQDPLGAPLLGEASIPVHGELAEAIVAGDTRAAVQHMLTISRIVDEEVRRRVDEL